MGFEALNITNKSEALDFIRLLDESNTLDDIKNKMSPHLANTLESIISTEKKTLEEVKHDARSYLKSLKDIVVYTSFNPSKSFINNVSEMFPSLAKDHLFDFQVNKEIVGGVKIVIDGKVFDETLKTKIDSLLQKA